LERAVEFSRWRAADVRSILATNGQAPSPRTAGQALEARAVRLVNDHQGEYSSLTVAAAVVARQLGVGKEPVRRWVIQSQVDGGQRQGATSDELPEIKALKAENRRLREDVEILRGATTFFVRELDSELACQLHDSSYPAAGPDLPQRAPPDQPRRHLRCEVPCHSAADPTRCAGDHGLGVH
jgi:transposase